MIGGCTLGGVCVYHYRKIKKSIYLRRVFKHYLIQRKRGVNPPRTRHCVRGPNRKKATGSVWEGAARDEPKSGYVAKLIL